MRVLLVTHEASRTGAPRIAGLVAASLAGAGCEVLLLSRRPGPLMDEFATVVPSQLEPAWQLRRRLGLFSVLVPVARALDTLLAMVTILRHHPDIVYINSVAAVAYLRPALLLRRTVVLHGHESRPIAEPFIERARARRLLPRANLIACSPSVRADLAELAGVVRDQVALVPSIPDADAVRAASTKTVPRDYAHDPDTVVVGACGSVETRKGTDLWIRAARKVRAAVPEQRVAFVWVGETVDAALLVDEPGITFAGPTANPYAHMRRFDIATLPSRDDPFPLVVLEAMLLGVPMVAFDVGGVATQVGDGGILVPPEDVDALAAAIIDLMRDPERRARLGRAAADRVEDQYSRENFDTVLHRRLDIGRDPSPPVLGEAARCRE